MLDIDTMKEDIKRRELLKDERKHGEREVFCLALSTIYGVRQVEIRRMQPEHIDKENHLLRIYTAKKNPRKWHIIPEPIRDVVENFSIEAHLPRSRQGFYYIFHRIFDPVSTAVKNSTDYNEEGPGPYGFHSIRRRLLTKLGMLKDENGERLFEKQEIIRFMRWTEPSESMYGTYFNPPEEWKKEDQLALDRKIFEHHPLLDAWKD